MLDACLSQLREMSMLELIGPEGVATLLHTAGAAASGGVISSIGSVGAGGVGVATPPTTSTAATTIAAAAKSTASSSSTPSLNGGGGSGGSSTPAILPLVVDKLAVLIRSGVGLPTRGASARFIVSLTSNVADGALAAAAVKPLLRVLMGTFEDASPTLRKEFTGAAAHLARLAPPTLYTRLVKRLLSLAREPDSAALRASAGVGVLQLTRYASEQLKVHFNEVIPLAFMACCDPEEAPAAAWGETWEALAASAASVLR